MTRLLVLLLIATSLHAQDPYAPTRPTMRRGPELASVSPSRQAAIAKALIDPDPHDLIVLLGLPDLWPQREPVLMAATPKQPPPQPMVKPSQNSTACHVDGQIICPNPGTPVQPPVANLVQPIVPQPPDAGGRIAGWPFPDGPPRSIPQSPPQPILQTSQPTPIMSVVQPLPGPVLVANPEAVLVTVSPMSRAASDRILGKRIGKIAAVWLVTMENTGSEPVLIAPSAIQRRISHLEPFDHASMSILIDEGIRNSFLARSGRAASDIGRGAAFMIAFKAIKIGESWPLAAITGADIGIPYLISRLKGAETPVSANFERLAWSAPIQIGPGESATAHLFAAPWDNPSPVSFSIDVSRAALRKSLQ